MVPDPIWGDLDGSSSSPQQLGRTFILDRCRRDPIERVRQQAGKNGKAWAIRLIELPVLKIDQVDRTTDPRDAAGHFARIVRACLRTHHQLRVKKKKAD